MRTEGCWIFISHSSKDIKKIRMIRNEFEKYGQNPLAFHLKCLNTDTEKNENELLDLIKREIEAREWFVFCESSSSLLSKYVQLEREYVLNCDKKMIWRIDLNASDERIKDKIKQICCDLQIFISYSHRDSIFARRLSYELEKNDYYIWNEESIMPGDSWSEALDEAITSICKKGLVLLLLSKSSLHSQYVNKEIQLAKRNNARIMVFLMGDFEGAYEYISKYNLTEVYNIPNIPNDDDMHYLVELINTSLYYKINGTTKLVGEVLDAQNKIQEVLNYNECYHEEEAIHLGHTGPDCDYSEIYKFPCCGKHVLCKDEIPPSRFRADGCQRKGNN